MSLWCNVCGSHWLILCMISCLVSWCHALSQSWLWMSCLESVLTLDDCAFDIMPCLMSCLMMSCFMRFHDVMFYEASWCHVFPYFSPIPLFGNLFHCLFEDPLFMILNDWSLRYMTIPFLCYWLGNYFRLQVVHIDHHGFCMVNDLNFL